MKIKIIICVMCIATQFVVAEQVHYFNLEELLERSFSSFEMTTNGCFVTFASNVEPCIVTYAPGDSRNRPSVSDERFFFPYGETVHFRRRDSGIWFGPLTEPASNGFSVKFTALNKRDLKHYENKGDILFSEKESVDDKKYKILNEIFLVNGEKLERPDIAGHDDHTSLDSNSSIAEDEVGITKKIAPKTNVIAVQVDNSSAEPAPQTATEETIFNPWKFIFPTLGILLIGLFALFIPRKR